MNTHFLQFNKGIPCPAGHTGRVGLWLLVSLVCITGIVSAKTVNDPLTIPAEKTLARTALASMLFDVVNTGKRLVVVGERGHIFHSKDNGNTWIQAYVPVSVTLTAVYFPTAQQGWAVGHDGVVLHSSDGGDSWTKQLDGNQVNALVMTQAEESLAAKKTQIKEASKELLEKLESELEDLEFFMSDAKMAVEEGPTRPFMDVWFKNEKEGWVIGAFGLILETRDGGASWLPIADRMDNPDGFHYYSITRTGASLFIAGEGGMLFRSDDEGKNWNRLDSPYEGSFFGIMGDLAGAFVVAFGMEGKAYRSGDNGNTWEQAKINSPTSLSGGAVLPDGSLIISAINGVLFHSSDGGKLFSPLSIRFPGCVAISKSDTDQIIFTGLNGLKQTTLMDSK